jgi:hypothetical protein
VTLALKIVLLLVVLMVIVIAALRIRKLRRDEIRELSRPVERRLMSPPPSPYAPSKGFRLLDGPLDETHRPEPMRPKLETDREYVFSESQTADDAVVPTHLRHNEKWALSKSARRSASYTGLRVGVIALVIILIVGAVGLYIQHRKSPPPTVPTTTTTAKHTHSTTTTLATTSAFFSTAQLGSRPYVVTQFVTT